MKLLVLSDIHGHAARFKQIVAQEPADHIVSLGDSELSIEALKPVDLVLHGNAYQDVGVPYLVRTFGDFKVVMTHGHLHQVLNGDEGLLHLSTLHGADLCLHGHTHVARLAQTPTVTLLNPGAIAKSRSDLPESYAVLTFEQNQCHVAFKTVSGQTLSETTLEKASSHEKN